MKGIYKIENIENKKCYIGSSNNVEKRWKQHLRYLRRNKHANIYLQRAFNIHGEDKFLFSCIKEIKETDDLLKIEQEHLNEYKKENLYNICDMAGAPPSRIGTHPVFTEDHKRKLAMQKGWKHTEESRLKMSIAKKINPTGIKNIQAAQRAWKGRHHTQESLLKMSIAQSKPRPYMKGIKQSQDTINKRVIKTAKPVNQIDKKTGEILRTFKSGKAAEIELMGKVTRGISAVCLGKQKTAHGYKWEFNKEI